MLSRKLMRTTGARLPDASQTLPLLYGRAATHSLIAALTVRLSTRSRSRLFCPPFAGFLGPFLGLTAIPRSERDWVLTMAISRYAEIGNSCPKHLIFGLQCIQVLYMSTCSRSIRRATCPGTNSSPHIVRMRTWLTTPCNQKRYRPIIDKFPI